MGSLKFVIKFAALASSKVAFDQVRIEARQQVRMPIGDIASCIDLGSSVGPGGTVPHDKLGVEDHFRPQTHRM
jgi:hypothetical protein